MVRSQACNGIVGVNSVTGCVTDYTTYGTNIELRR